MELVLFPSCSLNITLEDAPRNCCATRSISRCGANSGTERHVFISILYTPRNVVVLKGAFVFHSDTAIITSPPIVTVIFCCCLFFTQRRPSVVVHMTK